MPNLYRRNDPIPLWAEGISYAEWMRLQTADLSKLEDWIARRDYERKREAEAERAAKMEAKKKGKR